MHLTFCSASSYALNVLLLHSFAQCAQLCYGNAAAPLASIRHASVTHHPSAAESASAYDGSDRFLQVQQ